MDTERTSSARPLRSPSSNFAAVLAAGILLSACAAHRGVAPPAPVFSVIETQVWNDSMPGSAPRCHAIIRLKAFNASSDTLALYPRSGALVDARNGRPLRSFQLSALVDDRSIESIVLPPASRLELTVRSRSGLPPIDMKSYRDVVFSAAFSTISGPDILVESPPARIFSTK
jgi:hypothetical protein